MSPIRQYGKTIINLTKAFNVEHYGNKIWFRFPLSSNFGGSGFFFGDLFKNTVKFNTELEAKKEFETIKSILEKYYSK